MIAYVKGILESVSEESIVIETNNIGYEIRIPSSLRAQLPSTSLVVKIFTYLYVREDAMLLYGFISEDDLNVFKLLLSVSGIGPKGALGILSVLSSDELRLAVMSEDDVAIAKAPGVGKKTAQRLIIDLKDKLKIKDYASQVSKEIQAFEGGKTETDLLNEAVQALVSLGYSNSEAIKATKAVKDFISVEDLLKQALKQLARL